jgi:beta-aspartyl-peptidase (threonine type)
MVLDESRLSSVRFVQTLRAARDNKERSMPAILVHGGAGPLSLDDDADAKREGCLRAARVGHAVLMRGGSALDAVEVATRALEDDPQFNAGTGAVLNAEGEVELDASLMDGATLAAGAVAAVRTVKNPVSLARAVMERSPHVLLAGPGAEAFARSTGFAALDNSSLVTERARRRWEAQRHQGHGTVGAVAVDAQGHLAAATSTGGTQGKLPGRVGDSPLIGCGTLADDRVGAASATGVGELIIRLTLTRRLLDYLDRGRPADQALTECLEHVARLGGQAGLILATPSGLLAWARSTACMPVAWVNASGAEGVDFDSRPAALVQPR